MDYEDIYEGFEDTPRTEPTSLKENVMNVLLERQKLREDFANRLFKGMSLPLSPEQSPALSKEDRETLQGFETDWAKIWLKKTPPKEQLLQEALENSKCDLCGGTGRMAIGELGKTTGIVRAGTNDCWCVPPRKVQHMMDKIVRPEYREVDFRTLKPSHKSCLPLEFQQQEIDFLKNHLCENYFFIGGAGTSKTTFATALLRENIWRNKEYAFPYVTWFPPNKNGFVWKVNAETLFVQNQQWKTTMTSEAPAPAPDVTPEKIEWAISRGLKPLVVIEELDKVKFSESRINFLFDLVDAIDGCKAQIVVTSNRSLDRFMAMFTENVNETVRVTGEPLMRRLLKNCNVRDYFRAVTP